MASMATASVSPLHVYDGDIIQLYCPLEAGYVYSELNSTSDLDLSIVKKENIKVADFAAFSITLKKESENDSSSKKKAKSIKVTEKIAYGSVVHLEHQASDKSLIANNENDMKLSSDTKSLFRVVSFDHELAWGEELKDNDLIKLELVSSPSHFDYNDQRKYYYPTLKTVFNVQIYCHEYMKQNPKSIKGGSVVFFGTLPKIELDGYIRAKGSFVGCEIEKFHEQPSTSYGVALEEPAEQPREEEYTFKIEYIDPQKDQKQKIEIRNLSVYLIKFMEKKLPEFGDTLFQLERVSGPPGSPILFGEECRIKHLFTLKYIFITPERRVSLCDFNIEKSKFKIQQVSGSTDKEEVCNFDEITLQHVESSLYLSVNLKPCQHEEEITVSEDSEVVQSQFKLLQVEKSLLVDCYLAIGFSSFLWDSFTKFQSGDIDKVKIYKERKDTVAQIEKFYKARCESTKYRFIYMLWNLDVLIKGLSERSPQENGGYKLCAGDQEQVTKPVTDPELHIEKLLYEKSLAQSDTEEWTPLATLVELLKKIRTSDELLTKYDISHNDIKSCLDSYDEIFQPPSTVAPESDGRQTAIEMNSSSPLHSVPVRLIRKDDRAKVSQLLLMLHLLFTKYVFTSVRSQSSAIESIERNDDQNENLSKNFKKFFENNCENWCKILSRLMANKDYTISYMSVSLLFNIYMKEEIIKGKKSIFVNYGENVVPMESKQLELVKKMLLMHLKKEDQGDLKKFLTGFYSQDKSKPNVAANNLEFVYNSGLFHIILEYTLKHNTYPIFYEEEVICCCFELLQGLAASNEKIRNEVFCYFFNFLQFKRVTNIMICLINEIFYGDSYLSKKLTKSDLGKIFYTAIMSGTAGHYQWTIVLQTIVENSDQGQAKEHVAQLISKHSNDYLQHVLYPREQRKANYWLDILQSNEERKDECHLLLSITDLLASCASGECQYGRLVAMKLIFFDDLMKILKSEAVPMYRKLPFIRILTVTYLTKKSHFITNCSQYKELWSHIKITIDRCATNSGSIASISHRVIYQQIVKSGKYMQPVEDMMEQPPEQQPLENIVVQFAEEPVENMMELLYITDGVIPFLSELCQQMSNLSSKEDICSTEELQSVGEKLALELKNYCSVSEKLVSSQCIKNMNSLLINEIPPPSSPDNTSSTNTEVRLMERCQSIEPSSNYHENIVELLQNNDAGVRAVLNKVIFTLKNLVILHKRSELTCFKRIDVEETISRMLVLLQTVMKEVMPPSKKPLSQKEVEDLVEVVKNILYLNDCSNKEHTIFHFLLSQNKEIIFQVVKVLKMESNKKEAKEVKVAKEVQEMMISSGEAHDNIYIVQVHRLLREAHEITKSRASDKLNNTELETKAEQKRDIEEKNLDTSEKGILAALDIIILLCDRQHRVMQDAMRNSEVFISGSNIVSQVAVLLFYITEDLDENNLKIAHTAVKALVKMCTGNYDNQHIAYKCQVVTSINCVLEKNGDSFAELKSSCIKLLDVMLEEIDENSSKLAIFIADHLKINLLYQEMRNLCKLRACIHTLIVKDTLKLCRAYHILKRIADYKGTSSVKLIESVCPVEEDDKIHQKMWKYCSEQWSRSVEIVNEEKDIVTRAYFPFTPHLHIKGKNDIQLEIKRSTPQEKLLDLIKLTKAVEKTHRVKDDFRTNVPLNILFRLSKLLLIFLTILLNVIVLFTVNTPSDYNMPNTNGVCTVNETCNNSTSNSPMYFQPIWSPDIPEWSTKTLYNLGFIHFILAVLMVIGYFYRNRGNLKFFSCQGLIYGFVKMLLGRYLVHRLHIEEPQKSDGFYKIHFFSFQPLYHIFFTIFSFVAWIPYSPLSGLRYFYCLCMLYPFLQLDVMSFISRAIKKSIKRLASVLLLCFIFIYIYAVISFAFINNYFSEDRDQFCGSLWQCFITVSRLGLLSTLGYELDIRPIDYEPDFKLYVFRTFYDLIFFIVVTTLGLSIITATLVDRFSEMREKSDEVNEDNESRCFICSIERSKFDENFKTHVEKEHNMWNYMRFIIYVKHCCHENDHNALEKYVYDKVKDEGNESIDFFPLHKAKSLPDYEHEDSTTEKQSTQPQQAPEEHWRESLVVRHEVACQTEDIEGGGE